MFFVVCENSVWQTDIFASEAIIYSENGRADGWSFHPVPALQHDNLPTSVNAKAVWRISHYFEKAVFDKNILAVIAIDSISRY